MHLYFVHLLHLYFNFVYFTHYVTFTCYTVVCHQYGYLSASENLIGTVGAICSCFLKTKMISIKPQTRWVEHVACCRLFCE